ncbi:MAG: hypothetical protein H0W36_14745, partial [Gemmatimonadetes bacterium]|nr:hypothetical protein [Gemmatimonadota bacterium]
MRLTRSIVGRRSAGLIALLLPATAFAMPAVPPGVRGPPAADAVLACPLYWHPGEPPGLFPHALARAGESAGGLADASGHAELRAARGWIEVGRPQAALALLDSAPAGSPEARLYRLGALAARERWDAFEASLTGEPREAIPTGCGPLVDRWSARSAMARGEGAAADRAFDRLMAALPELTGYVTLWRLEAAAAAGDLERGEAAWERVS